MKHDAHTLVAMVLCKLVLQIRDGNGLPSLEWNLTA